MKRFWTLLLCMIMLLSCSGMSVLAEASEIDLSGMTLDELRALKERITMAMWETEEWLQATLRPGVYEIGVDIPAAHWDLTAVKGDYAHVIWCRALNRTGKGCDDSDKMHGQTIMDKNYKNFDTYMGIYPNQIDLELIDGTFLIVEQGPVILTPYAGNDLIEFETETATDGE